MPEPKRSYFAPRPRAAAILVALAAACSAPSREPVDEPAPMPGTSPIDYPVELWDLKIQGEAMLMVHVTEAGSVDSAYVLATSGFSEFDSAAVRGAHAMRFSPGRQGQRRIAMWTRLPVRFTIDTLPTVGLRPPATHQ